MNRDRIFRNQNPGNSVSIQYCAYGTVHKLRWISLAVPDILCIVHVIHLTRTLKAFLDCPTSIQMSLHFCIMLTEFPTSFIRLHVSALNNLCKFPVCL